MLRSAKRYVASLPLANTNASTEEDDWEWEAVITQIGLTKNLQTRITNAKYREMRLASTLKETIYKMFELRYEFLASLDNLIKNPPAKGVFNSTEEAPKTLEGHTILLKARSMVCLQKIHDIDGSLNFSKISSTPPSDFSALFRGIYLTKNYQAAWQDAQWISAIIDGRVIPIAILHIAIPNSLLASTKELDSEE